MTFIQCPQYISYNQSKAVCEGVSCCRYAYITCLLGDDLLERLQVSPSGREKPFVDIKLKVPPQHKLPEGQLSGIVNQRLFSPQWTPCIYTEIQSIIHLCRYSSFCNARACAYWLLLIVCEVTVHDLKKVDARSLLLRANTKSKGHQPNVKGC